MRNVGWRGSPIVEVLEKYGATRRDRTGDLLILSRRTPILRSGLP